MSIYFGSVEDKTYSWLSNFAVGYPIKVGKWVFPTSEHLYQCLKCLDGGQQREVQQAKTAWLAKQKGRLVHLQTDWEDIKIDVMRTVLLLKVYQNDTFAERLLSTTGKIVEISERDLFWGARYEERYDQLVGQNHLGRILVGLREYGLSIRNGMAKFEIPEIAKQLIVIDTHLVAGFYERAGE